MQAIENKPSASWLGVGIAFVVSGFSGLIYQSLWSEYLSLMLGSAAYAQAFVLALFMGGMALGAALVARRTRATSRPLRAYATIELVIGIIAVLFHSLYVWFSDFLFATAIPAFPQAGTSIKWLAAALILLPQTILLGATFPYICAALIRNRPEQSGSTLGTMYFLNSIGAALGALVTTFYLTPTLGLPGAMKVAALFNFIAAALAFLGDRTLQQPAAEATAEAATADSAAQQQTRRNIRVLLVVAFFTGMSSFMYEIGWIRMLSVVMGASLHAFELMLSSFIGGLAIGGLVVGRWLRSSRDPMRILLAAQLLMGGAALLSLVLYPLSFEFISAVLNAIARSDGGYTLYNLACAALALAIMFPAAFFAGMTLPAITFIVMRWGHGERSIGQVYASNTLGAIAGVFLMIHLAIPALGLKSSMVLACTIDIALGLVLLKFMNFRRPVWRPALVVVSLAAITLTALLADFDPRRLASGVFRYMQTSIRAEDKVFYYADGKTASVAMTGNPRGVVTITTNGKPDASIRVTAGPPTMDEPTMVLAGLLGIAHHPDVKTAAVIGFGSGLTTHTLASAASLERIDTIEIEREMVRAAYGFGDRVDRAYSDPRSKIIYDDARAYFSAAGKKYDLIVSEPSNPWVAGVGRLFSREFYRFTKRHLGEQGLLIQWLQAYEVRFDTQLSILAALDAEYEDYLIYTPNEADMIIVARPKGTVPELGSSWLSDEGLRAISNRIGILNNRDLALRRLAGRKDVQALLALRQVQPNSDFYPTVTFWAPKDRFVAAPSQEFMLYASGLAGAFADGRKDDWRSSGDALTRLVVDVPIAGQRMTALVYQSLLVAATDAEASQDAQARVPQQHQFLLKALHNDCQIGIPDALSLEALVRALASTILLDEPQLRAAWASENWTRCEHTSAVADFLRMADAFVRGDHPTGEAIADTLSNTHPSIAESLRMIAIWARLRHGDFDGAQKLVEDARSRFALADADVLRLLATVNRLRGAAASPAP